MGKYLDKTGLERVWGKIKTYVSGATVAKAGTLTSTLDVSKGGTGKTTLNAAANSLINSLTNGDSTPVDTDYYISQSVNGGSATTTYHRRPMSALWAWIKGKTDSLYLGISGNAASATKLTTNAGSTTQPVYFSGGKPVTIGYTIAKSVPSNALFTDTNTWRTIQVNGTSIGNNTLNLKAGSNVSLGNSNGTVTINATNTTYSAATQAAQGLMSAADKKKLDGIAEGADNVVVTTSLSSGTKIGTVTVNGVAKDLYCEKNTNTTYTAGAGLSLSGTTFALSQSGAVAGTYGMEADTTGSDGTEIKIPRITVDGTGRVTGIAHYTFTAMNTNINTDTKVTQTVTTANASYPLLLAPSGQTANATTTSYFDSGVTLNPSTNTIAANVSGTATSANQLTTARKIKLGGLHSGEASFNGTADVTINDYGKHVVANNGSKNTCPFHRIAYSGTMTGQYNDMGIILMLSSGYQGGRFGIVKIALRSNASTQVGGAEAHWIVRKGYAVDDIQLGLNNPYGNIYIDVYLKFGSTYQGTKITVLDSSNRGSVTNSYTLVSSSETDAGVGTNCYATIAAASTALNRPYTSTVAAVDGTHVNSANSATSASKVTDSGNGTAITLAYSKDGLTSTSWLAAWNGYELRAMSPANITAGAASSVPWSGVTDKPIRTASTLTSLGWSSGNTANNDIPNISLLAYWDGAYNANGNSNLKYCKHGAFGTMATESKGTYIKGLSVSGRTITYTKGDGTTGTITTQDTNTTYSNMTAATASAAGKAGLVPAPAAGKQTSFLRGDGTWAVPTNTTYSFGDGLSLTSGTVELKTAGSSVLGGIKLGYSANGKNYPLSVDANGKAYVNVPWTDNNTTYTFNGAVSTIKDSNLTASRALISNSSGKVAVSAVTSTELGYLDGVTSNVQTQLNAKAGTSVATTTANGLMSSTDKSKLNNYPASPILTINSSCSAGSTYWTLTQLGVTAEQMSDWQAGKYMLLKHGDTKYLHSNGSNAIDAFAAETTSSKILKFYITQVGSGSYKITQEYA